MNEIIYILINESMPGYVKIGLTSDLEQRIRSLDNTSTPLPFECFYACTVKDANFVEKQLHDAFLDHRVRSSREFFQISPERAVSALKLAEIENVTPNRDYVDSEEDQQALNQARSRRAMFNFRMVDIPIGAELTFINDENLKARVIKQSGQKTIEFQEEETSPSAAAQKIMESPYQVQGTIYWMFEGETLDERRRRLEGEE
jgi:hypothetical protein